MSQITFMGNPLTLVGTQVQPGDTLPATVLHAPDLSEFTFDSLRGKTVVVSTVPSLDTPVCDAQTRHFNEAATELGEDVVVVTVSMDLPFAQARFCTVAGIERVVPLSDYRTREFAKATGLLIEELQLLTRAVLIADKTGVVRYAQIVGEITTEPDYDEALAALAEIDG